MGGVGGKVIGMEDSVLAKLVVTARVVGRGNGGLALSIGGDYAAVLRRYAGLTAVVTVGVISWVAKLRGFSDRDVLYVTVPRRLTKFLIKAWGGEVEVTITVVKA